MVEKKKKIYVVVTQEDIEVGSPAASRDCPIAQAVGREVDEGLVTVGRDVSVLGPGEILNYELPARAQKFIEDFDRGNKVYPIRFPITLRD